MQAGVPEEKLIPFCRKQICSGLNLGWIRFLICVFYLAITIGLSGVVANLAVYSYLSEHPGILLLILISFPIGSAVYWLLICWGIQLAQYIKSRR